MNDPTGDKASTTPEARRELLRRLLEQKAAQAHDQPVSAQQERLWVAHHLDPTDPSQNLRSALRIEGPLDAEALQRSFECVLDRHDQLRATFHEVEGRPVARIAETVEGAIERLDLRQGNGESADEETVEESVRRLAGRPFDLSVGPLARLSLLELSPTASVGVLVVHHIVCDAWSMDLVLRDLLGEYTRLTGGDDIPAEPPASHDDYVRAQGAALSGAIGDGQRSFWHDQLDGFEATPAVPIDRERRRDSRTAGSQMASRREPFSLGTELQRGVGTVARSHGATGFMVLLSALGALLHRVSGSNDMVIASPVANRADEAWESIVGYFVNLLPLRLEIEPDLGFDELLGRTRRRVLEAQDNQMLPVHQIAEAAGLRPAGLVEILYQHVAAPARSLSAGGPGAEIRVTPAPIDLGRTRQVLSLTTFAGDESLAGILEYSSDLLEHESVARLIDDFGLVLSQIVTDPTVRIADLEVSSTWERQSSALAEAAASASDSAETPRPDEPRAAAPQDTPLADPREESAAHSTLAAIWAELLELDDISPFDNFLDIGGDSLLAMQVIERTEQALGVRIAPADLFTQTLTQLAASVEARRG